VAVKIRAFVAIIGIAREDADVACGDGDDPDGHPPAMFR